MTTALADLWLLVAAYGLAVPVLLGRLPVLCAGLFVEIGAVSTEQLHAHGVPLLVAVVLGSLLGGVAGAAIGPAGRGSWPGFALASWALAWLGYELALDATSLTGGDAGVVLTTPAGLSSPTLGVQVTLGTGPQLGMVLVVAVAAGLVFRLVARGGLGARLLVGRDGELLAAALGVRSARTRSAALAIAGALGALAGAGLLLDRGVVAPPDTGPLLSVQLLLAVVVAGAPRWWTPPVGVAVLVAVTPLAHGLASLAGVDPVRTAPLATAALLVGALLVRYRLGRGRSDPPAAASVAYAEPSDLPAGGGPSQLALVDVVVRYGATEVLDGASLSVRRGEVVGLVGANGAGKTSLLDVACGAVRSQAGTVRVDDHPAGPGGPPAAARRGVARSTQRLVVAAELTARDQARVAAAVRPGPRPLAVHALLRTRSWQAHLAERDAAAAAALAAVGLGGLADERLSALPVGAQRLAAVAAAVATGASVLLLDEPAAGADIATRRQLVDVVRRLAAGGRCVLLVEHDAALVRACADRTLVLAGGKVTETGLSNPGSTPDPAVVGR